jgi:hypothetical protein
MSVPLNAARRICSPGPLERVCESLDVPMWEVIRDAERAE